MAHSFKNSGGKTFCSKCGVSEEYAYRECVKSTEPSHSYVNQNGKIFCTKCGEEYHDSSATTGCYSAKNGHKYKVFANGEIKCSKCGSEVWQGLHCKCC